MWYVSAVASLLCFLSVYFIHKLFGVTRKDVTKCVGSCGIIVFLTLGAGSAVLAMQTADPREVIKDILNKQ